MQKKYLTLSFVLHMLLGLILVVGSAFVSTRPSPPSNDLELYEIIPSRLVEDMISGGGGAPAPRPPGPAPQSTATPPEPIQPKVVVPEPPPTPRPAELPKPVPVEKKSVSDPPEEDKPVPADLEKAVAKKPVRTPLDLSNLKRVTVKGADPERSHAPNPQRQAQAAQKAWNQGVSSTVDRIKQGLSSGVSVDLSKVGTPGGTGTGGESYGNYQSAIYSIYNRMWIAPPDLEDEGQVVVARIIIARDGRVTSSRITQSSGNRAMDNSVLRVLDRIDKVPAPPDSFNKPEITVTLEFSLKAKRLLG